MKRKILHQISCRKSYIQHCLKAIGCISMGLFIAIIVFSSCGKDKDDDIIDEEIVYYECTKGEEEFVLYGKKSAVEFQIQELNKTWEALGTPVRCKRKI
ncbi:hypothetical protein [Parabacteroides johnsonii]|uniref:hypothetical protein n=1 Tax=Parabacteroides johnsonii TaxID=387661 RepID=UPI0024312845|nr:hypothetical protein [Parabacteroides johnsonii]